MGKILPILMALIGVGAGIGAGFLLKPAPKEHSDKDPQQTETSIEHTEAAPSVDKDGNVIVPEFVKMNNQFVIPVIKQGKMAALVVLSISIEVIPGGKEATFQREPKLRDAFNQVLFDHANSGGFDGVFTRSNNMIILRDSLYQVARRVAGPVVRDILIGEIVRQDI